MQNYNSTNYVRRIDIIEIKKEENKLNELGVVFAIDLLKYLKCGGDKSNLNIDHIYNVLSGKNENNNQTLQVPTHILDKGESQINVRL